MQYGLTWSSDALNRWPCTLLFHDRPYLSVQLSKQVLQDSVSKSRQCNWKRWDKAKIRPGFLPFFRVSLENQLWSALLCWICGQWQRTTHSGWLPTAPHPVDSLIQYPPTPPPSPQHHIQYSTIQKTKSRGFPWYSSCSIIFTCTALSNPPTRDILHSKVSLSNAPWMFFYLV